MVRPGAELGERDQTVAADLGFAASIEKTPHWPSPRLSALAVSRSFNREVNQP